MVYIFSDQIAQGNIMNLLICVCKSVRLCSDVIVTVKLEIYFSGKEMICIKERYACNYDSKECQKYWSMTFYALCSILMDIWL
jgi:hypothetical protein